MAKHTDGPWYVAGDFGPIKDSQGRVIAYAPGPSKEVNYAKESNLKLIAAAPELLAACELMYKMLRGITLPEHGGSSNGFGWDTTGTERAIGNLISKAK